MNDRLKSALVKWSGLYRLVAALLIPALVPLAHALQITSVQRGIHDGFELVIVNCDTISNFELEYDQVRGECRLSLKGGKVSPAAAATVERFRLRQTIKACDAVPRRGTLVFHVTGTVFLREYLVNSPAALILDFSHEPDTLAQLPFECDRQRYLALGGRAEREGDLDWALRYVERVRSRGDTDAALAHRAGVIGQRLGRWDLALETFAKTAGVDEFAADAHARRAMIYFAKGDTAASGAEWAGFFHHKPQPSTPDTVTVAAAPPKPEPARVAVSPPPVPSAQTPPAKRFSLPSILQAGGGDGASYLYYGWGLLAVGLVTLVGLWAGSARSRQQVALEVEAYRPFKPVQALSEMDFLRTMKSSSKTPYRPLWDTVLPAPTAPPRNGSWNAPLAQPNEPNGHLLRRTTIPPILEGAISPRVVAAYKPSSTELKGNPPPPTVPPRVPAARIVALAGQGLSEAQIANDLMVGRDEVAMVINLSRLARKGNQRREE